MGHGKRAVRITRDKRSSKIDFSSWNLVAMEAMECGHYKWEQQDDGAGSMTLVCLICGHTQHLYKERIYGLTLLGNDRDGIGRFAFF